MKQNTRIFEYPRA